MRKADDWIDLYLDYTENTEPPTIYKKWCAVSVIAGALRRKCWLDWGLEQKLYPNLYVVLVGPPGRCRKGTAMGPAESLLQTVGVKLASNSVTREALIKELEESSDLWQSPDGEYIAHASLTIWSEELTVFLSKDNRQLIMDLTDWYDCHDNWRYRTKTQGTDDITGVWVNLLGATTPQQIQKELPLDAVGGGLASRMIFVYQDKIGKRVPAPFVTDKQKAQREVLIQDLIEINELSGSFTLTESAMARWTDWYLNMDKTNPDLPPTFEGYINRRQTNLRKLAMIMSVSRSNKMIITVKDFDRALDLLTETEKKMARTFAGMGTAKDAAVLEILKQYIADNLRVSLGGIMRDLSGYIENANHLQQLLGMLKTMGFCRYVKAGNGKVFIEYLPGHKQHDQYGDAWERANKKKKGNP